MSNLHRYLKKFVLEDLNFRKMVFIGGPRQVGKTTFAFSFLKENIPNHPAYLNWDQVKLKSKIRNAELPPDEPLIILDEIHKYASWRNLLKGIYDTEKINYQFIITGSARLDHYRKGGDSLLGRYHYYRLHPLSVSELKIKTSEDLNLLLKFGGFPEPFFRNSESYARRWRRERQTKIVTEDIRDLESIKEISLLEQLVDLLPKYIASPLSYQSFTQEIDISFKTAQHWIDILDKMYFTFRLSPYVSGKLRLVKKTHKIYFWDWGLVENEGARFENLMASHLFKYCHFLEDTHGHKMELKYLRDVEGREIDFIVLKNKKILFAVECKTGDRSISKSLHYFKNKLAINESYQVHLGSKHFISEGIEVIPFIKFNQKIGIP